MERQLQAGTAASRRLVCLGLVCLWPDAAVLDAKSSQAASNWGNARTPGNPNDLPHVRSDFDVGHRLNLAASYGWDLPRHFNLTASMYYNGQSGRPYSISYNNTDVNVDAQFFNDLLWVPNSANDVVRHATERRSNSRTSSTVTRASAKAAAASPSAIAPASHSPTSSTSSSRCGCRPAGQRGAHVRYPELHQPAERRMGPLRVPRLPDAEFVSPTIGLDAAPASRFTTSRPLRHRPTGSSRSTTCGRGGRASSVQGCGSDSGCVPRCRCWFIQPASTPGTHTPNHEP